MINSTSLCSFIFASKCPYRWFGRILFDSIEITKDFHYLSFHLVSCELDVTRVESLITRDVAENWSWIIDSDIQLHDRSPDS